MTISVPAFPRCQEQRPFGPPPGQLVQCKLGDPHPDRDCDFGIDWPHYGRNLDTAAQPWLAGTLRDVTARLTWHERRETDLTAVAVHLAAVAAGREQLADLPESTLAWVDKNAPGIAVELRIRAGR